MRESDSKPIRIFLEKARERIEATEEEFGPTVRHYQLRSIDEYLEAEHSDLEKAFFLMLHQFWNEVSNYFVVPSEKVCVNDVYDTPGVLREYEIDFAIYSGTRDRPVKIAVECDGIRSHRQRYRNRDRRKDVNLQAAGWIVLRFGSVEIHDYIQKLAENQYHVTPIYTIIDNVIASVSQAITPHSYVKDEVRSQLTGYQWAPVKCPQCGVVQRDVLGKKTVCRHCQTAFQT